MCHSVCPLDGVPVQPSMDTCPSSEERCHYGHMSIVLQRMPRDGDTMRVPADAGPLGGIKDQWAWWRTSVPGGCLLYGHHPARRVCEARSGFHGRRTCPSWDSFVKFMGDKCSQEFLGRLHPGNWIERTWKIQQ